MMMVVGAVGPLPLVVDWISTWSPQLYMHHKLALQPGPYPTVKAPSELVLFPSHS
jgi:hypothetical protein